MKPTIENRKIDKEYIDLLFKNINLPFDEVANILGASVDDIKTIATGVKSDSYPLQYCLESLSSNGLSSHFTTPNAALKYKDNETLHKITQLTGEHDLSALLGVSEINFDTFTYPSQFCLESLLIGVLLAEKKIILHESTKGLPFSIELKGNRLHVGFYLSKGHLHNCSAELDFTENDMINVLHIIDHAYYLVSFELAKQQLIEAVNNITDASGHDGCLVYEYKQDNQWLFSEKPAFTVSSNGFNFLTNDLYEKSSKINEWSKHLALIAIKTDHARWVGLN